MWSGAAALTASCPGIQSRSGSMYTARHHIPFLPMLLLFIGFPYVQFRKSCVLIKSAGSSYSKSEDLCCFESDINFIASHTTQTVLHRMTNIFLPLIAPPSPHFSFIPHVSYPSLLVAVKSNFSYVSFLFCFLRYKKALPHEHFFLLPMQHPSITGCTAENPGMRGEDRVAICIWYSLGTVQ